MLAPRPPASVVTTKPVTATRRRTLLPPSDTYRKVLVESTTTELGPLKRALLPAASTKPASVPEAVPPPAMTTTLPPASVTARMRLLPVSATYSVVVEKSAMPRGPVNLAAVPAPAAKPAKLAPPPPKTVETTLEEPASVTCRMTLLPASPT